MRRAEMNMIVIVAVILPIVLFGVFGYFAYLVDGAEREGDSK